MSAHLTDELEEIQLRERAVAGDQSAMVGLARKLQWTHSSQSGDALSNKAKIERLEEGLLWATKAADEGSTQACFECATIMVALGEPEVAREWCEAAIESKPSADVLLFAVQFAFYPLCDQVLAEKWTLRAQVRATETGDRKSLGLAAYRLGWFAKKNDDIDGARHWYGVAQECGHGHAKRKLREIGGDETPKN